MKKTLAALFMLFFIITAHATEPARVPGGARPGAPAARRGATDPEFLHEEAAPSWGATALAGVPGLHPGAPAARRGVPDSETCL